MYIGFLLPILSHASFTEHFCIEPLDSLNAHVIQQHNEQTKQAIDNYKNLKDYKWLHMLPSVGYDTRWNTPVVAVSSTQFVSYFQHRDTKKYNIIQLQQQSDKDLDRILFNLKGLYNRLLKQLAELETRYKILTINKQLYDIENEKYKNVEIDTEEFLKAERAQMQQVSDFQTFKLSIYQTIAEIENITKRALLLQAPLLTD